jgi:hypothetical protein
VSAVIGAVLWGPYYAYGYGYPYSGSAKSRNPARKRRDPRQLDLEEELAASAGDAEKDASTDRIPTSPRDHDGGVGS